MNQLNPKDYRNSIQYIDEWSCGAVYPCSIAETIQHGDIFTNNRSFLFWHYCGFAFIYGDYDESFLNEIYEMFLGNNSVTSRRFILFVSSEEVKHFFLEKDNIILEHRYFFDYQKGSSANIPILPVGYKLCEIDKESLYKINGIITPSFSWDNSTEFLKKGKGYCIIDEGTVAAWAFTVAISEEEIDIGIETNGEYRHLGLGTIVAEKMIQYSIHQHKRPIWACHSNNMASQRLAEKLGFVKISECYTIKKC